MVGILQQAEGCALDERRGGPQRSGRGSRPRSGRGRGCASAPRTRSAVSLLPAIKARPHTPFIPWPTRSESAELVRMMEDVDEVIELSEGPLARIMRGGW